MTESHYALSGGSLLLQKSVKLEVCKACKQLQTDWKDTKNVGKVCQERLNFIEVAL